MSHSIIINLFDTTINQCIQFLNEVRVHLDLSANIFLYVCFETKKLTYLIFEGDIDVVKLIEVSKTYVVQIIKNFPYLSDYKVFAFTTKSDFNFIRLIF